MTERPTLFSAPMVRAILAGTKTQTRRVLPTMETLGRVEYPGRRDRKGYSMVNWLDTPDGMAAAVRECRYGQPGDRLWVRETWRYRGACISPPVVAYCEYKADGARRDVTLAEGDKLPQQRAPREGESRDDYENHLMRWFARSIPAIHMPRWASRITLEVTGVRAERLQDISEADAMAEGVALHDDGKFTDYMSPTGYAGNAVSSYRSLWTSINGPGSWEANPWVWVLSFKRVMP